MESHRSFEAVVNDFGLKEMEQGIYDWVGEIQQTKLPFNKIRDEADPTPSPIAIVYKYGCFFALMIDLDGEDNYSIKFWIDLLEHRGEHRNHGYFLVELTLMEGDLSAKCTLTLPKSANATVHGKLHRVKMINLVGWFLKIKIDMLEVPDPMLLSNEIHPTVEVKTFNKATQFPILKDAGTNTLRKTMDQNTQTVFVPISTLALKKLCDVENNKETKSNADGSIFEDNPFLVETGSQTNKDEVPEA